jgi:DNA-binding SARP family transcriptional activator
MIHIRTLGPVAVDINGGPPPTQLLWRRNLALLIYLACSPRRTRTREHLVGLLWPDKDERAARHSLNEALRLLRRVLGGSTIDTAGGQVRLAPGDPWLDVEELDRRIATRDTSAAELVGGEFMEGFGLTNASGFEDWLSAQRAHWRGRSLDVLLARADELERSGRVREAIDFAERAVALDPLSERAARAAMRARALAGDRGLALTLYAELLERLGTVGARVEAATDHLAERIRRQRGSPEGRREPDPHGTARRAPLVGRDAQLTQLVDLLRGSAAGSRALLGLVEGEAGTGKTRMLDEAATRARLDGALVATARAIPADREEAGGAAIALARGGLLEGRGLAGAAPAALATFAQAIPEWQERFPGTRAVQPVALPGAFIELLRAAAGEQPVLLCVDDAHHLDGATIGILHRSLRDLAGTPLMVLLSAPPQSGGDALEELRARMGRDIAGGVVHLDPLRPDALANLVRWALPSYAPDAVDRLVRRLATDSAGLPLLAVELVCAVTQGLDLGVVDGCWPNPLRTLSETRPGDLPDAVRAAVRIGYRRLSPGAQRGLAALAVLEDRASAERVALAAGLAAAEVHPALDELEWARWITADPRGYAFVARVMREIVLADMTTPGQRHRMRDRAGVTAPSSDPGR